jgi:7,8-dihydropterin-6-yl-methyl-4-(beta-D-ribofuranosyl)aminobenzene 5'-phosphate synthase
MQVIALLENTRLEGRKDLVAEHGLSLHIQHGGKQILFDTGLSEAFGHNAERLGVDIQKVDLAVISHHHVDHGGGLSHLLEVNPEVRVYLRRRGVEDRYFRILGIINKNVGLDKGLFERYSHRFEFVDEFTEISPGVFILTEIGKPYPQPRGNRQLFVKEGGTWSLDSFEHELILVIRERDGVVVFTGCSHSGILNMVDTVTRQFQGLPIKAVFGGFHLISLPILNTMAGSKREVEDVGKEMVKYPIDKIYTGHCTGQKAYRVLKGVLGEKLEYLPTGGSVEV